MIQIDGNQLTIAQVVSEARYGEQVVLSDHARQGMIQSHTWVQGIVAAGRPVYGINTGFGIFADQSISAADATRLTRNLILSHAVATGPALPRELVRAAMLIRANTLASGFSGVRPVVADTLLQMLAADLTPVVPSQGSLGSSGDLAPLSHLALVFSTDELDRDEDSGWADYLGERMNGKTAMAKAGISRLILGPKEGLAVNNGATFSAAIAALAVSDALHLLTIAEYSCAMSLEAMLGVSAAFDPRLHAARRHPGQIAVAAAIRKHTRGSTLMDAAGKVQDAYSLRCAPQVQGAARDAADYVHEIITREINAATDNPLLFEEGVAISGGNFHGEPVGIAMDLLSVAMAEVGAISERRIFRLTDAKLNAGLPPMLVNSAEEAGLNSGMMMPQYTAASLVLENQTLANPDSVHSLPTSAEQEDHNANSMTAARNARQIIVNTTHILAIEMYCAARALDLRLRQMPAATIGAGVSKAYKRIRQQVPFQAGDAWWGPEIERVHAAIVQPDFVS